MTINSELDLSLDILRPLIYVVTEEEDRVISDIYRKLCSEENESKKLDKNDFVKSQLYIYRTTNGLCTYDNYQKEIDDKKVVPESESTLFNNTLEFIYKYQQENTHAVFVLLDVDHYLIGIQDANIQVIRKLKDITFQCFKDATSLKSIIILSSDLVIPKKLQRYIEVIYYDHLSEQQISDNLSTFLNNFNASISDHSKRIDTDISLSVKKSLKTLTEFEINQIALTSIKKYRKIEPKIIEEYKKSIIKKTNLLDLVNANVTFDDVGGMDNLKEWLTEREGSWTDDGISMGVPLLKGLLLIGITGCGKTLIGKAIANHWGLPFVVFNPSRLFSSRVGESENNIIKALKIVESISPCVMFIDEIEKQFAGSQSSSFSDAGTTSRFIGNFLTWYQDHEFPIFVVATCNSVEYLPPEMISRFDEKFFVNLPSFNERRKIFEIQLKKHKKNINELKIDYETLAGHTTQFTGREIEQIVKSSIHKLYHDKKRNNFKGDLELRHVMSVINSKVPIVKTMDEEIKYMIQWVGWDEEKQQGIRASWANKREVIENDIDVLINEVMNAPSILKKDKRNDQR
jgi:SpoVK/Ycf46/Vps4 family AAA+-type ATPase